MPITPNSYARRCKTRVWAWFHSFGYLSWLQFKWDYRTRAAHEESMNEERRRAEDAEYERQNSV